MRNKIRNSITLKSLTLLLFLISLSSSIIFAQDVIAECSTYSGEAEEALTDQTLVFVVPKSNHYEIWYSTRICCPVDTGQRIPRGASNLELSPNGHKIVYSEEIYSDAVNSTSRISVMEWQSGNTTII